MHSKQTPRVVLITKQFAKRQLYEMVALKEYFIREVNEASVERHSRTDQINVEDEDDKGKLLFSKTNGLFGCN